MTRRQTFRASRPLTKKSLSDFDATLGDNVSEQEKREKRLGFLRHHLAEERQFGRNLSKSGLTILFGLPLLVILSVILLIQFGSPDRDPEMVRNLIGVLLGVGVLVLLLVGPIFLYPTINLTTKTDEISVEEAAEYWGLERAEVRNRVF